MLRVWLPLNGNLHNQGCSNVTVTNNGATVNVNGKIGSCYHFGTASQYMTISKEAMNTFTSECSIAFWLKIKSWNTSYATYFQAGLGRTAWTHYIFGFLRNNANSTVCFTISNGSSASNASYLTSSLSLDTWYHVVLTYTTGKCTIYLNGTLDHEYTTSIVPNFAGITTITLGKCNNGSSYQTDCDINDFRIYDHALSAAEVREISQGLVLHYKLDQSNPNLISNDTFINAPWATAIAAYEEYEGRLAYRLQCKTLYTNTSSGTVNIFPDITYQENTQYTLSITWRDDYRTDNKNSNLRITFNYTDGSSTNRIQSPANTTQSWTHTKITSNSGKTVSKITASYGNSGYLYITDLKLEIGTLDTGMLYTDGSIEDSSGYNHNGACVNTTMAFSEARYDNCISCLGTTVDGSSNTITGAQFFYCNMDMPAMSAITVTWWGKNIQYGRGGIFETSGSVQTDTTKGSDHGTTAIANWDSTFRIYNGSSSVNIFSNFIKDGNWHHHVITFDGTNVKYYCDNILKQTGALTGTLPAWKSFCMGLGKAGGVWRQIKQYVSDLRIYCTALDADAIRQLYEVGAKVDNKQNLHAFELVENNSKIQITKRGQVKCNELEEDEKTKFYQTDQIIETNEIIEL